YSVATVIIYFNPACPHVFKGNSYMFFTACTGHTLNAYSISFHVKILLLVSLFLPQCFNNWAFINIFVFGTSFFKIYQHLFNSLKIFNFTLDVLYLKDSEIIHITALRFIAIDNP